MLKGLKFIKNVWDQLHKVGGHKYQYINSIKETREVVEYSNVTITSTNRRNNQMIG